MSAAVQTTGLTKRYGGLVAVDSLDMRVRAGEVYGFLGPNGAGTTTTLRMLLGLVRPTAGTIRILGAARRPGRGDQLARVGALVEGPAFYPFLSGGTTSGRWPCAGASRAPGSARSSSWSGWRTARATASRPTPSG
jgi:ABC-type multidrug transport system ATPase subunit